MFNLNDRTFTRVSKNMTTSTALQTIDRIVEYCDKHGQDRFALSLHGGEPTLWPRESFEALLSRIESVRRDGLRLQVGVQTNGVHLRPELARLLADNDVSLGISIDGPKEINDRMRVDHSGRGSFDRIMRTVQTLLEHGYGDQIGGFLCVAQPDVDPEAFLGWASRLPITRLDVLWPLELNHDVTPWGGQPEQQYADRPRYGSWMADLFEAWFHRDDPSLLIRSFFELIAVLLGSGYHSDSLVNQSITMFVVNTDGGLEYHDFLRPYTDGGTRSPYNVVEHSLTKFATDPTVRYLFELNRHLPSECAPCDVLHECGGGFLAGRTKKGEPQPRRRSVLCFDQHELYSRARSLLFGESSEWRPPLFGSHQVLPSFSVHTQA